MIPLTVKQYKIRQHLANHLNELGVDDLLSKMGVTITDGKGADADMASWVDAFNRTLKRLVS